MKRIRILALMFALLVSVSVLTGCNALKLEDVQADPMKYVKEGTKMTLGSTPFSILLEQNDKIAYQIKAEGDGDFDMSMYLDTASKKGAVDFDLTTEYEYLDENGETLSEEENVKLSAFYADKQFVLKADALKDILGTDAVGVDFDITAEEFKETGLFNALCSLTGMTEEEFGQALDEAKDSIDGDKLKEKFTEYTGTLKELTSKEYENIEVAEEELIIGEKTVKTISVTLNVTEDYYNDIYKATTDLVSDLIKTVSEKTEQYADLSEEDVESVLDQLSDSAPEVSGSAKYYLSAKTGALVKMTSEAKSAVEIEGEKTEIEIKYDVVYGANPEICPLPTFTYEMSVNEKSFAIDGKASIEDGKIVFEGNGNFYLEGEEPDLGTYRLEIAEGGEYTLTLVDDDGEYIITGKFISSDNEIGLTMNFDKAYGESEEKPITDISFVITLGEEVPALPEYKDVFDFTDEDLMPIISMMGAGEVNYDELFYMELMYYMEVDEDGLNAVLSNYSTEGYASEQEYMYALYANNVYLDLFYNWEVDSAELDAIVNNVANAGGTYYDLALAMYEAYEMYTVPTEDEIRDYLDNYAIYGYSSQQEVIDELYTYYGDYITIPPEYLGVTET